MEENKAVFFRRKDILLLAAVLLAGGLIGMIVLLAGTSGANVEIRVDGKTVRTLPLSANGEYPIDGYQNGRNLLVIENGAVHMQEASCPDGLCIHMGSIRYNGQSIICLPNRVVVEIVGGEEWKTDRDITPASESGGMP